MLALFDTNILIDYLSGIDSARKEIARYESLYISPVTWMEVMVGVADDDRDVVNAFLDRFKLVDIDLDVAQRAVKLRQEHKIKLPDAIIWASANKMNALLITRNSRDFPEDDPSVRIPYQI